MRRGVLILSLILVSLLVISGCVQMAKFKRLPVADDGLQPVRWGCTDPGACNYDGYATHEDGSCEYVEDCIGICGGTNVCGCTDSNACNYDPGANIPDATSCEYPGQDYDCNGNCLAVTDCFGTCGGSAEVDQCGECGGDGSSCMGCNFNGECEISNYENCVSCSADCYEGGFGAGGASLPTDICGNNQWHWVSYHASFDDDCETINMLTNYAGYHGTILTYEWANWFCNDNPWWSSIPWETGTTAGTLGEYILGGNAWIANPDIFDNVALDMGPQFSSYYGDFTSGECMAGFGGDLVETCVTPGETSAAFFITWVYANSDFGTNFMLLNNDDAQCNVFNGFGTGSIFDVSQGFIPVSNEYFSSNINVGGTMQQFTFTEGWNVVYCANLQIDAGAPNLMYCGSDGCTLLRDHPNILMMSSLGPIDPAGWVDFASNRNGYRTVRMLGDFDVPWSVVLTRDEVYDPSSPPPSADN